MFKELKKIKNLNTLLRSSYKFEKTRKSIKPMSQKRKHTMVIDVEGSLISQLDVQNHYELEELRKTKGYKHHYLEY